MTNEHTTAPAHDERSGGLLAWQWSTYLNAHRDRRNLIVHAITNPLFLAGNIVALSTPIIGPIALLGLAAMAIAMILQGRTHKLERTPPAPFRGPLDVVARIFAEQWITFPRYLLSGGFTRAWRAVV
jgi:hypothetical protein